MATTERIARICITLDDFAPRVWRRVEVPVTTSLKGLHDVIQAVMLFEDYHLFEFRVGDRRYAIPDPEWDRERQTFAAQNIRIGALLERGVTTLSYTYDFGDNWQHTVELEGVVDADVAAHYPRFIEGERRAPPEDVGGVSGFEEFLEAIAKPRHPQHRSVLQWYGKPFDPLDIGIDDITARMERLVRRRLVGKASYAKSRNQQQ